MQGSYLKFLVHEGERHDGKLLYEWLLEEGRRIGLAGGSAFRGIAGFGRHGVMHEQHFIELAGSLPVEVVFAISSEDAARFLSHLAGIKPGLVYIQLPAEMGRTGA